MPLDSSTILLSGAGVFQVWWVERAGVGVKVPSFLTVRLIGWVTLGLMLFK